MRELSKSYASLIQIQTKH